MKMRPYKLLVIAMVAMSLLGCNDDNEETINPFFFDTGTTPIEAKVLLDNFNDNTNGWELGGVATIEDGMLKIHNSTNNAYEIGLAIEDLDFNKDYEFEARVKISLGYDYSSTFSMRYMRTYTFQFSKQFDQLSAILISTGTQATSGFFNYNADSFHTIKVVRKRTSYQLYFNGTKLIDHSDNFTHYGKTLGFMVSNVTAVDVDYFKVTYFSTNGD